jgi:hypothetical protein
MKEIDVLRFSSYWKDDILKIWKPIKQLKNIHLSD